MCWALPGALDHEPEGLVLSLPSRYSICSLLAFASISPAASIGFARLPNPSHLDRIPAVHSQPRIGGPLLRVGLPWPKGRRSNVREPQRLDGNHPATTQRRHREQQSQVPVLACSWTQVEFRKPEPPYQNTRTSGEHCCLKPP